MSPELFQDFMGFFLDVTQGNEHAGPFQGYFLLLFLLVEIRRIRMQGEFKIPLCNFSGGKLLHRPSSNYNELFCRAQLEPCQTSTIKLLFKICQRP